MDTSRFVLYRNLEHQDLFGSMAMLLDGDGPAQMDGYACANRLLELAAKYGFEGNLWHCFLAYCLAAHENAYSTACEIVGPVHGTINELAAHDFSMMKELFDKDTTLLSGGIWGYLSDFHGAERTGKVFNRRIRDPDYNIGERTGRSRQHRRISKTGYGLLQRIWRGPVWLEQSLPN